MRRSIVRTVWLLIVRQRRRWRRLWRCPLCQRIRRWTTENVFDVYPMLERLFEMPACCAQEFPKWAYAYS